MSIKAGDSRALIATVRHWIKAGNVERAQQFMGEFVNVPQGLRAWAEASPEVLEQCCQAIEAKLDEAKL